MTIAPSVLEELFARTAYSCPENAVRDFGVFADLLFQANTKMNLTAVGREEFFTKHILDSLQLLLVCPDLPQRTVLDLGTGAGLPGLPLKIVFPQLTITFLDAEEKKLRFVRMVTERLGLTQCSFLGKRAEEVGRDQLYRESFSLVVARALADMPMLVELAAPLLAVGGDAYFYKGPQAQQELLDAQERPTLLGLSQPQFFETRYLELKRSLIHFHKEGKTPTQYPRSIKKMRRDPLW